MAGTAKLNKILMITDGLGMLFFWITPIGDNEWQMGRLRWATLSISVVRLFI